MIEESTVKGTLDAFAEIMRRLPPEPDPGEGYVLCDRNDPDASHYLCGDTWYFTVNASKHHETTPIRKLVKKI